MQKIAVVVPNWNGKDRLKACLDSLRAQTLRPHIIVVDNGSADGSAALVEEAYPDIELIKHDRNKGYAGGMNPGFRRAIELGFDYVAAFNNDAVADKQWLGNLAACLDSHDRVGIAACKLLTSDGRALDSTGDYYTAWGLPYPRGRNETAIDKYDGRTDVFAASGGASLYRVKMLEAVGLFDEDFFAYYEDVDLSFRAQLAGWKVRYVPAATARHQIGGTSGGLKGFTTYQTLKNLPMLMVKNVPRKYLYRVSWRLAFAQTLFFGRAVLRGHGWSAAKGKAVCLYYLPRNLRKRKRIQAAKTVGDDYIWSMMVHDLPPNAAGLRRLRSLGWKLRGRKA